MIREETEPLLLEITQTSNHQHDDRPPREQECLVSLDVLRGFIVVLMIFGDHAGGGFPSINHSPWFGVTLADFVMPFFLFTVGLSASLVFKVDGTKSLLQTMLHSNECGTAVFAAIEILFWGFVAGFLNMKQLFIKL